LLYKWEGTFIDRGPQLFAGDLARDQLDAAKDERIAELERMVGRLTMEVDILKKCETWLPSQRPSNGR
jgi:transposase